MRFVFRHVSVCTIRFADRSTIFPCTSSVEIYSSKFYPCHKPNLTLIVFQYPVDYAIHILSYLSSYWDSLVHCSAQAACNFRSSLFKSSLQHKPLEPKDPKLWSKHVRRNWRIPQRAAKACQSHGHATYFQDVFDPGRTRCWSFKDNPINARKIDWTI